MIRGLQHFKDFFEGFGENYILVGGVASYLLLDEIGAPRNRATKDLDIVLMMKPSAAFLKRIKEYVQNGRYEIQKGDRGQATFFRFKNPESDEFPIMIELFAAVEIGFELFEDQHIVPITTPADVESLSAILLDGEYYSLIEKNCVGKDGINLLSHFGLIPFKAKAYLEIKERKEDSKNWKKHRRDIINLAVSFLSGEEKYTLTGKVREHFVEFLNQLKDEIDAEVIKGACKQNIESEDILRLLENTFL